MIQYIYFVKCPNCEDEHFDFFDEAKACAMSQLSKKPIITQTEVNRNDFGECIDSCDLGTVWSWEDMMSEAEPAKSVFTKDDLEPKCSKHDAEFDDEEFFFDNNLIESAAAKMTFRSKEDQTEFFRLCSEIGIITGADLKRFTSENLTDGTALLDKLKAYRAELGDDFEIQHESCRKPVPEGMTLKELVEAMEENEDTVECVGCEELYPKDECFYKDDIGWLCGDCEDSIVKCTWCEELYDRSECRKEADMGWLCGRCEAAIKSRGETLTFREGNYWDFLDESIDDSKTLADLVKDSINHLTNDIGKDPWAEDFADDVIADLENNYDIEVPANLEKYCNWASAIACEVSRQVNNFNNLTEASLSDITAAANREFGTGYNEQDILDSVGIEDGDFFGDLEMPSDVGKELYAKLGSNAFGGKRGARKKLEDLDTDEIPEVSDSLIKLCPECGKNAFDTETGICVDCGFN